MNLSTRLGIALLVICAADALGDTVYSATPLGNLPYSVGFGINDSGQITGQANFPGALHAFVYDNGMIGDLGTLAAVQAMATESAGAAINDVGQITGNSGTSSASGNFQIHAFLYANGAMNDLGTLPGGNFSEGNSINSFGQVVGFSNSSAGFRAFLYSNGVMTDLGALAGSPDSSAQAINNSGQVTGGSVTGAGHAFLYANGVMLDLGTLGGLDSRGFGINNRGQVTGESQTVVTSFGAACLPGLCHAFLYGNGEMIDLGTLPGGLESAGYGINDAGQIVGYSTVAGGAQHAFVYSNGIMTDLNSVVVTGLPPGLPLMEARAINDSGQIVANAGNALTGPIEAFLLTPVPETSTMALMAGGMCALAAIRRWQRNMRVGRGLGVGAAQRSYGIVYCSVRLSPTAHTCRTKLPLRRRVCPQRSRRS